MTIVVGCDNAAVELKNTLIACLKEQGVTVEDEGCMDASDPTVYPLVAKRVCENIIRSGYAKRGVLVCGTGIGMCITANKFSAERSILSNNGNVLCFGARVIGPELAKKILREWITLEFQDGSSTPKVQAILDIERENMK